MKIKYRVTTAVLLITILASVLLGCNTSRTEVNTETTEISAAPTVAMEPSPTPEIPEYVEGFLNTTGKRILRVEKASPYCGEIDVNADWLKNRLAESELCETPSEILAMAYRMKLYYDDGSRGTLRLLNHYDGVCALEYKGTSYCFKNDELAQWFLGKSEEESVSSESASSPENFTELTNMHITKVKIDLPSGTVETGLDIEWLENELKLCQECEIPDEDDKLDMPVDIYYEDGTITELFIYNVELAYFLIRHNDGDTYCFRSESIAQWLLDIKEEHR